MSEIQIKKTDISGKHCKLTYQPKGKGGIWKIKDLNSTNGVCLRTKTLSVPLLDIVHDRTIEIS